MSRGRDLAGWLGAAAVTAGLFAGAAAAALRGPLAPGGDGAVEAVALDLSVGVVAMAAVLPSAPPAVVAEAPRMAGAEVAPEVLLADPVPQVAPVAMPRPDLAPPEMTPPEMTLPEMTLPEAEAPPILPAAPPPPPEVAEPTRELAVSPRPQPRPERARRSPETPAETAEAPRRQPAPEKQTAEAEAAPAAAQAAGATQAVRPAEVRRAAGGQSAAQYGDVVMRQIAKLRRQKAPERGKVTVGFEIGADGGLRRVAVVASSGSVALDQVAVDHIRRAAPFPPPPEGAATRFAFEFVGR